MKKVVIVGSVCILICAIWAGILRLWPPSSIDSLLWQKEKLWEFGCFSLLILGWMSVRELFFAGGPLRSLDPMYADADPDCTCPAYGVLLSSYLTGTISAADRKLFDRHLDKDKCEACKAICHDQAVHEDWIQREGGSTYASFLREK